MLWEIWTLGIMPYPGMTDDEVVSRINQWYRLYKPHECPSEIYNIMTLCWKEYYRARPRFSQIANYAFIFTFRPFYGVWKLL